MAYTMKAFWQDLHEIVDESEARALTLNEALDTWADGRAVEGNFFGLIDEQDRTIQFYFVDGIPDHVEDARHLRIVHADFPVPDRAGSFTALITIGEASEWIEKAFKVGANPDSYEGLGFSSWQ